MNFSSVPVYSMGKKLPSVDKANNTCIGPGKYNETSVNVNKTKQPEINFGKQARLSSLDKHFSTNGPGKYETNSSTLSRLLGKIGNSQRQGITM